MDPPRSGSRSLLALVLVSGATSLGAEIAAARLLAPYFGGSTIIWANTIAVVLVALSFGYFYGGRLADRHPDQRKLRYVVLAAAVALAAVPLLAGPFFDAVIPAFDRLDAGAFLGSLLGVLTLLAAPLLLLGTVTPWALRLAITDVSQAGQVAGRLYAVSTLGSLSGVFLAALVTIPAVGTQRTFIGFGVVLATVAATHRSMPRRMLLVPVVLAVALIIPPGATKDDVSDGYALVEERETPYQYLRVITDGRRRLLELNEGQAVHSVWDPDSVLTGGVWDGYLTLPYTVLERPVRRMAMLGNAAGTVSRAYARYFPATAIDGVEIDPEVTDVGRRLFDLGDNRKLRTFDQDARPFLRRSAGGYDLIGIDAYRQPYIPFYLATEEFFALVRARLQPGGAVIVNVGHPAGESQLERAITRALSTAFPNVRRFPIASESTLLIASATPPDAARLRRVLPRLPAELAEIGQRTAAGLRPALPGGRRLTDDRAPVEWLIDSSIVRFAARGERR